MQDRKLAEHHAKAAERLLAVRLGIITNIIKAGVHATFAIYYSDSGTHPEARPQLFGRP
jgi:hypothetical protein